MFKDSKWAKQIIELQDSEGKWGYFHSLSTQSGRSFTTEQALRRLEILGYTIQDECIYKAVQYMDDCLAGKKEIPDRREKEIDWEIFVSLMLAAWIRRFTNESEAANNVADKWTAVITDTFKNAEYDYSVYEKRFREVFGRHPKGRRLQDFTNFYSLSVLKGCLDYETEEKYIRYILQKPDGIYYVYEKCLNILPLEFESRQTSRYLGAIELLSEYKTAGRCLAYVSEWLKQKQNSDGYWDMGPNAKDGIYYPLSDNWRINERRTRDCSERIERLLTSIDLLRN